MNTTLDVRDRYIVAQALATAIEVDKHLPHVQQEPSNNNDRKRLLEIMFPSMVDMLLEEAEKKLNNIRA